MMKKVRKLDKLILNFFQGYYQDGEKLILHLVSKQNLFF